MKYRYLIWLVLVFLFGTRSLQAQEKIQPVDVNVPIITQDTPEWCWAAATEMVIKYRDPGSKIKQCEILEKGYRLPPGACCGREQACVVAARDMSQIQFALQAFGGVYSTWTPPQDPMMLYQSLKAGIPIIAQVRTGLKSTHAIVLRGMKFPRNLIGYGQSIIVPTVIINDPMVGDATREMPYVQLVSSWIDSIVVLNSKAVKKPKADPDTVKDDGADLGKENKPPPQNDLCAPLQRVTSSLPTFRSITGELFTSDEKFRSYISKVQLPNFKGCTVNVDLDVSPRTYSYDCDIKLASKECSAVDEAFRTDLDQIKACLPKLEFKEEDGKEQFDVAFTAESPAGYTIIFQTRYWQSKTSDEEHCSGFISITKS